MKLITRRPSYFGLHSLKSVRQFCPGTNSPLEARIDGLALQGQDSEGTFVDPAKRLLANESFESFDSKSEFAERQ